jgi:hypothetical protein
MKWLFVIKERYKIAVYLTAIFVVSIAANLFERTQVNDIDKSIISMYNDRIIPAKDISSMLSSLYKNQLLLQEHIHATTEQDYLRLEANMQANYQAIDSLTERFAKTFLVDTEVVALNHYKSKIARSRTMQDKIIALSREGLKEESYHSYQEIGQPTFQQTIDLLNQLADIQVHVGQELYKDSHQKLAGSRIVSSLEIGIAIVIGIIANLLLKASVLINRKQQQQQHPHLN